MANKRKQFSKEFKEDAVKYYLESDLSLEAAAKKLNMGMSTLQRWVKEFTANDNQIQFTGSGKRKSDIELENTRLKRELRDAEDALEILKKAMGILTD
jgi:Transposase and inactivated derivatives